MSMMIVDPYRFAASGPSGDVTISVADFDTGASNGTVNIRPSALSGLTPTAAMVIVTMHTATNDPNETPGRAMSIGVLDGTRRRSNRYYSRDNAASTVAASGGETANALFMTSSQNSSLRKTGSVSLVSDGIDVTMTDSSYAVSARSYALAFAGADVTARADSFNLGTGTSAQDVTAPGFLPSVVIFLGDGYTASGSNQAPGFGCFGIAVNDGSATQRCVMWSEENTAADGAPMMALRNDCALGQVAVATGNLDYRGTISDFDASGFSITCNASAGSDVINYLALKFDGRQVKLVDFTTPTSTGNSTITGAGFTPSFALAVLTSLETVNDHPGSSSDNMAGYSICAIGSDEVWSASTRTDSGVATTDTASQVSAAALLGPSATDCDAIRASFVAWTSDGVTVNYSAVQGTGKLGFILFVE